MIKDLKELEKLLKLCRKQGVTEIKLGDIALTLGDLPTEKPEASIEEAESTDPYANFPTGTLTPEQLIFYSSGGIPENDPTLKESQ